MSKTRSKCKQNFVKLFLFDKSTHLLLVNLIFDMNRWSLQDTSAGKRQLLPNEVLLHSQEGVRIDDGDKKVRDEFSIVISQVNFSDNHHTYYFTFY